LEAQAGQQALARLDAQSWWQGVVDFRSWLAATKPGSRGVVYESGGSGLVAFYDFSLCAGKRENQPSRYMAAGIPTAR
jgi:hypothetical protein